MVRRCRQPDFTNNDAGDEQIVNTQVPIGQPVLALCSRLQFAGSGHAVYAES